MDVGFVLRQLEGPRAPLPAASLPGLFFKMTNCGTAEVACNDFRPAPATPMIAVVDSEKRRLHGHLRTDRVEGKTVKRRGGGTMEEAFLRPACLALFSRPFSEDKRRRAFCFRGVPAAIPEQMGCF